MSLSNYLEIRKELILLLEQKNFRKVAEILSEMNEVDVADFINESEPSIASFLFRMLPKSEGAEVFSYLDQDTQIQLLEAYTDKEIEEIIKGLYDDDFADMLDEIPANVAKRLLQNTSPERRNIINKLLQYPEESAGSLMTTEYVRFTSKMTVKEAIDKLRHAHPKTETIYTCYVTSEDLILHGVISIRDVLTARDDQIIGDLMTENVIYAKTTDDQEGASKLLSRYDLLALPVVDSESRLVGIITIDDAIDTMAQETSEDMAIMAAVQPTEKSYFENTVWDSAKHRVIWLMLLMISGMINGEIVANYEHAFVAIPALVTFMPMLTDTGGNAGSQSSGLLIRAIALDEVHFRDLGKILWRELRIALLVGAVLSLTNLLRIYYINGYSFRLALTVSLTLYSIIIIAKLIASFLPLLAKALKLDPALMAAPLITTIADAVALVIYFNFAQLLLPL